jgi:PAS domain S-box-containing protein
MARRLREQRQDMTLNRLWWFRLSLALIVVSGITVALIFERSANQTSANVAVATDRYLTTRATSKHLEKLADDVDDALHAGFGGEVIGPSMSRIEQAQAEFNLAVEQARRLIAADMPPLESRLVLHTLKTSAASMHAMANQSKAAFSLLDKGDRTIAAAKIASLDRERARLRRRLDSINEIVSAWQQHELSEERRKLKALQGSVISIVALLSFVPLGVGRRRVREAIALHTIRRREEELARTNAAFESATIGIAFVNTSGRIEYVNPTFATIVERPRRTLKGQPYTDVVHPDDREVVGRLLSQIRVSDKAEHEIRLTRGDGSAVEACVALAPSHDTKENFVGHYWFLRDVTGHKRAADALRESEERFHLASRALNDVIFDWNMRTDEAWVTEAWVNQFGYPASGKVRSRVWRDALHPSERDQILASVQSLIDAGGSYWSSEYLLRRGDGTYADVLTHAYIVRDDVGVPQRIIGATMDITERKSAERAMTAQILNSTDDAIYVINQQGCATFVNRGAARLLGWTTDELLGTNMHALVHHRRQDGSEYKLEDCPGRITLATAQSTQGDREVFWRKDGSYIPIEYHCNPILGSRGEVTGAVVTFRDITERRAVERMKDEFVSIVSHELRTPLTAIRGALGLLNAGLLPEVQGKAKHMLALAVSNTERLAQLVNDILDVERMDAGKVVLNRLPFGAQTLMTQAIEIIKPIADKSKVLLECGACDAEVFVDPDRIRQTFTNLLGNAVKFSSAGSTVSLSAKRSNWDVQFEVRDHGRGVPHDKLEAIFERFQQVDASDSREKGGTGLGLAICRSIVNQHGGEIWAENCEGGGASFRFTIPLRPAEQPHQC